MRVEQQWTGGVLVLSVLGKLNTEQGANTLRQKIDDLVAQGHLHLVLDLERVRHADQSGLDTLVGCLQTVRRAGGDLKLVGVTRRISARIVIAGLLRVFDVHDTAQAAVRAFRRMRLLLGSIVA